MRSLRDFIVKAESTHDEKEGSIYILERFENQGKVKQFHEVVAVPPSHRGIVNVGDTLCIHFNALTYDRKNGVVTDSQYHIKDNLFRVQTAMAHFVLKDDGQVVFLHDQCLCKGSITKKDVTLDSGIIIPDVREETKKKDSLIDATLLAKNPNMEDVEVGDRVCLAQYSDYEIKFPDGTKKWLVNYKDVLFKYDD